MKREVSENQEGEVFHFSSRNQRLSETVMQAVAWVEGVDPTDLEPLANFIDPAALDVIFAKTEEGMIEFEMRGLTIRVHSNGDIVVRRLDVN